MVLRQETKAIKVAVASKADASDPQDYDLMYELCENDADDHADEKATNREAKRRRNCNKTLVVEISMPLRPFCAAPDCKDTHICKAFLGAAARQQVYVSLEDIPWALSFAADEFYFQDVYRVI